MASPVVNEVRVDTSTPGGDTEGAGVRPEGLVLKARDGWEQRLVQAGQEQLSSLEPLVARADPDELVLPRNRLLCAGLGLLSTSTYQALGGVRHDQDVLRAGALLSLLTKVDDQIIDGPAFHGSGARPLEEVETRVLRYLEPTLRSLREGRPVCREGRCELAAEVGDALRKITADSGRLRRCLDDIALGWRVQGRAVAWLSARPGAVPRAEVERITTAISAVWLRMMARVGELPQDASRALSADEVACIRGWGFWIQRADALADLAKDIGEGLCSSLPGLLLWEREPAAYLRACDARDAGWISQKLTEHQIARVLLPGPGALDVLDCASLGELPGLLRFVHGFLAGRFTPNFRGSR